MFSVRRAAFDVYLLIGLGASFGEVWNQLLMIRLPGVHKPYPEGLADRQKSHNLSSRHGLGLLDNRVVAWHRWRPPVRRGGRYRLERHPRTTLREVPIGGCVDNLRSSGRGGAGR
jgi:hypothetical protein